MGVLDGKIAIVTGASRGIGAAIAERFGAEGAAVAVAARTTEPGQSRFHGTIESTAAAIREAGGTAVAISADLSKPEDSHRLVDETNEKLGPVDILVNNAAVTYFTPVADFSPRRFALMFAVQVEAPFELAKLVLPGMRERGRGWILNISSIAARPRRCHPEGSRPDRPSTACARRRLSGSRPAWRPNCTKTTSRSTRCRPPWWCPPRERSSTT